MPRIVREASVTWTGTVARGSGVVSGASSGAFELPYTLASRVGDPEGKTSPEELIAAAHASCYATSLGGELARAGTPPERVVVRCTITMDQIESGDHRIVASDIAATAVAPGADSESVVRAAEAADAGCPISSLIRASATVTVHADLEGESGDGG
jgi:lipoyl-dependent peroxiredoxin